MSRAKFNAVHDQAIADHVEPAVGFTPDLMCAAHGCPNRWTADNGHRRLCSAHFAVVEDPSLWPEITQVQLWNDTERIRERGLPKPMQRHVDHERLGRWLGRLSEKLCSIKSDPLAWARALKAREESGEKLHRTEREAWRKALPERAPKLEQELP